MNLVSLQSLLAQLRDGVWLELDQRSVKWLREAGVALETDSEGRYRWQHPVDLLDGGRIREQLSDDTQASILSFDVDLVVDSTNSVLCRRAAPPPGKTRICLAEYQHAGRGRRGRAWVAPFGSSLCLSVAWSFDTVPHTMSAMSLAVGVAAVRALRRLDLLEVVIKWPNDLLVDDAKLGGILVDAWHGRDGRASLVAGLGLNLHVTQAQRNAVVSASGLAPTALADIDPVAANRRDGLAALLIDEIVHMLQDCATEGMNAWQADWQRFDALAGKTVEVTSTTEFFTGRAAGVTEAGALLVTSGDQVRQFVSGEVSVRES